MQPNVYPGNCWAFKGHQGQVVIRLPARVYLTAITVQHITKDASPSGTISSAPKDIAVFVSLLDTSGGALALEGGQGKVLLAFVHPLSFVTCTLLSTDVLSMTLQGLERTILLKTFSGQAPKGSCPKHQTETELYPNQCQTTARALGETGDIRSSLYIPSLLG